ncbi:glycosyltransferase family 2 protein [Burkholderia stagnalis]|uniref:glycosyltransferase family 2 protein n=1 Tax=Burkholderia stagnalis TaxID=1503054 RepID=UPI00075F7751|nr:glycosyltransferase family 2 protein [Burkholderia stagnalis]KWI99889.1 glycosyl transferase family 2 [Burkholderia stagnalis]KWO26360.1 glycosyl transferase family 2 [Burkholderia stagnalis]
MASDILLRPDYGSTSGSPRAAPAAVANGASSGRIRVSAVMPCLNEEMTLAMCIEKAQRSFAELGVTGQVVIADNGSTDRSVEIARQLGAKVVHQPVRGYGAALMAGIAAADGDIVIMGDADDSYDWSNLRGFIEKIDEGYEFVIGNRFKGGIMPHAMPPLHRYLGNPVLSTIARLICRVPVGDFHCGMRAFTREAFARMELQTTGMEFASEMVMNAARNGLRIVEIPTVLYPDKRNRPPHLRSFRDGWRHLRFLLTYAPNEVFLAPGLLLLAVGLLLLGMLTGGPITVGGHFFGPHFLALGSLLSLIGFNFITMGVLATVIMAGKHPSLRGRIVQWATAPFAMEACMLGGAAIAIFGIVLDAGMLAKWLAYPLHPMESTAHLSIVATTLIVLGTNAVFSAFILNLVASERERRKSRDANAPVHHVQNGFL